MSKLIDNLTQSTQAAPPMGFRTSRPAAAKPTLQLIADITYDTPGKIPGADAGIVHISSVDSGISIFKQISGAMPDIPVGAWLEKDACKQPDKVMELGCDFLVCPADVTALAVPPEDGTGIVLQVDSSITDGQLRTVNNLPADAVLLSAKQEEPGPVTWHQLILWQHFAEMLVKPLLVRIPHGTGTAELQMLWDAGIGGVIVTLETNKPAAELERLRKSIDGLTPPSPRKKRKMDAIVPHLEPAHEPVVEIEEDEDE